MPFQYKRVLLVGATAGIGAAMADKLIHEGAKVIAVGRRQDRLDAFVKKHGPEVASSARYDTTDTAGLDAFVDGIVKTYPDLDCVFLNSGTQHPVRLSRPAEVDTIAFHNEMNTNFTSIVNLTLKFLPILQAKSQPTGLLFTGTHIAIVPAVTLSAYSASKAALHAFVYCLQAANKKAETRTKIIEIWPPPVQTEIHDYMGPEIGRRQGMPVDEFTEKAYAKIVAGEELVTVGSIGGTPEDIFEDLIARRKKIAETLTNLILAHSQA